MTRSAAFYMQDLETYSINTEASGKFAVVDINERLESVHNYFPWLVEYLQDILSHK